MGLTIFQWPHADWFHPIFDQQGNYHGVQRMPTDQFIATVVKMNRMGWRPGFHISGDRALELHLAAYEAADRDQSIRDKRWVAEHNGGADAEQTARLVKLNMLVSIQYQAGRFRDWIKEGLTMSSGSDWPAFDSNPFKEIAFYVTINSRKRKTPSGGRMGFQRHLPNLRLGGAPLGSRRAGMSGFQDQFLDPPVEQFGHVNFVRRRAGHFVNPPELLQLPSPRAQHP